MTIDLAIDFYTALKEKRTYYGINKDIKVSDVRIKEIVEFAVKHIRIGFQFSITTSCCIIR
jgi:uncharacterized protein